MEKKRVQMKGKLVPIVKLEQLAIEELDWYRRHFEKSISPDREYSIRRWSKLMNKALKKLKSIMFIRSREVEENPVMVDGVKLISERDNLTSN
ncbi:hypothetical protein C5167_048846 [Papaver somniferum]|uniref:Uncharacterized protein n=1 Tax=Papaver somniferum TaxID=3469 RepID=A0A4Y7KKG1_PAPSO|nr:hypothetical protein C5167_048846 [Papaver somniferum]